MIDKSGALSEELVSLRGLVRLSQRSLARASGVSEGTIRDIESGSTVSKPSTLRKLAVTLASDPLSPSPDAGRVESVYQRLLRAAGYLEDAKAESDAERRRPVEDLTDEEVGEALRRWFDIHKVPVALLSTVENWEDLAPPAQRFLLNQFEEARRIDEDIKAAQQRDAARPSRRPGS